MGKDFDQDIKMDIIEILDNEHSKGLTISGGDPLDQNKESLEDLKNFLKTLKIIYKDTKDIWIYTGYKFNELNKHQKEVLDQAIKALDRTIFGDMSVQNFCDLYGLLMTGKLQDYAINLRTPPNAALTVMWKGSNNPLVDHGKMIRAITWEVE